MQIETTNTVIPNASKSTVKQVPAWQNKKPCCEAVGYYKSRIQFC